MRARRAQNTVEMALVLPLLALLVAIGIDFARIYHVAASVGQSSRVAAEFAATAEPQPTYSEVHAKAQAVLGSPLNASSTVTTSFDGGAPPAPGTWFTVTVRLTFYPITPLARSFMPSGKELVSTTELRRNCAMVTKVASCQYAPP
jgi:Flp pilus assembly protein TadG